MRRNVCVMLLFALILFLAVGPVHAGGLWLTLQPTPDMGVGSAGSQAAGFDASTATANPAAMTRLDRSQVEAGIEGIYPASQFNVKNSSFGGNDGGNAGYLSVLPTLNYVHSVSPDLKLGLGVGSYFGLGLSYSNDWAGKYYAQTVSYTTMAINPTIGYRIAPWLSVGGGVSVVQGKLSERLAVNTPNPLGSDDGRLKYDASDVGYGYNLGVLFELSPQTRVGVTYVSKVDLKFKDDLRFKNLGRFGDDLIASGLLDSQLKIDWTIPAQLSVGAYHALTDKLALVGTVNWQNWSQFGQPEIAVADSNTVTKNLDYQDTYHAGLGVYYRVADPWLLMVGFGYDTSPTSSSSERSPALPLGAIFTYAAGVQYDWNKDLSVGVAYALVDAGSAKVNRSGGPLTGDLEGEYDTNFIHAVNLNFVYRF